MRRILLIATTRLCKDGLTEILLRIARTVGENAAGIALAEGGDRSVEAELRKWGRLYVLPSRKKNLPSYLLSLRNLIAREGYEIVHIHGNSATMAFDLLAAFLGGATVRITHVHNCAPQPLLKQKTLGVLLNRLVTRPVACSETAGKMLYTRPFTVLTNGVDCKRFSFSPEIRAAIRNELHISDAFVVGHIGRFSPQKNHRRLLHIFASLLQLRPSAVLLLCGEGEDMAGCREEAAKLDIADSVLFLGKVEQPQNYYQAMDVFVLPSLFEGLPLVGVEAQASGLPCVFSDTITREAGILPTTRFLPLEAPDTQWAKTIIDTGTGDRSLAVQIVAQKGYSIAAFNDQLMSLYSALRKENCKT